nr:MAG TPA: hypothetical protein [Crassvirales sp.]
MNHLYYVSSRFICNPPLLSQDKVLLNLCTRILIIKIIPL